MKDKLKVWKIAKEEWWNMILNLKKNKIKMEKEVKLQVGREYWLDKHECVLARLIGFSSDGRAMSEKYTFERINTGFGKIVYDKNSLPSEIHEFIAARQWKFITPIAMKCAEEQFNGIKDKVAEMGYKIYFITFNAPDRYICTGYASNDKVLTDLGKEALYSKLVKPLVFQSFNPDLFLALAAMTDKEDGINGEWWTNTKTDVSDFTVGEIYKQVSSSTNYAGSFVSNSGVANGYSGQNQHYFRKATAQEIIEHFEQKEFVLPEKWCVKATTKEQDIKSVRYFNNTFGSNIIEWFPSSGWWYYNYSPFVLDGSREKPNCTEITFDQFKKYVLKEITQSFQTIPIPPKKQATLFDDRVEITDWKPKEGEYVYVVYLNKGEFGINKIKFGFADKGCVNKGFIKRTESEAKQLVEKLKKQCYERPTLFH